MAFSPKSNKDIRIPYRPLPDQEFLRGMGVSERNAYINTAILYILEWESYTATDWDNFDIQKTSGCPFYDNVIRLTQSRRGHALKTRQPFQIAITENVDEHLNKAVSSLTKVIKDKTVQSRLHTAIIRFAISTYKLLEAVPLKD